MKTLERSATTKDQCKYCYKLISRGNMSKHVKTIHQKHTKQKIPFYFSPSICEILTQTNSKNLQYISSMDQQLVTKGSFYGQKRVKNEEKNHLLNKHKLKFNKIPDFFEITNRTTSNELKNLLMNTLMLQKHFGEQQRLQRDLQQSSQQGYKEIHQQQGASKYYLNCRLIQMNKQIVQLTEQIKSNIFRRKALQSNIDYQYNL